MKDVLHGHMVRLKNRRVEVFPLPGNHYSIRFKRLDREKGIVKTELILTKEAAEALVDLLGFYVGN